MSEDSGLLRDACIRAPLIDWLRALHPEDGSTELLQEFKMPRPSARIDLALVNGELAGFEIKSDADTLRRLTVQVPAFSRFFDRVSIVTTRKHLAAARKTVPAWWGIIVYRDDNGFRVARTPKRNRHVDVRSLLYALSKIEIAELGRRADVSITTSVSKETMIERAIYSISAREICDLSRDVLRLRSKA
jgi:hypothetical protein